uniref:Uncharacterized protein n=1 Tax=Chenopodium quinoa TaxID=63459 RepID=A0A803NA95_CHEQI
MWGGPKSHAVIESEKQGVRDFRSEEADFLQDAINHCQLEDLGYIGHDFKWSNNKGGVENVQEHLDRFLANRNG